MIYMFKEFKEFAMKGNIMDLAVGVVIGGAFQRIVNSLVNDIIMPLIATFTGKVDFSDLTITLGNSSIKYGSFITAIVNFLIIAFSIFLFIRYINKLNKKLEELKDGEIKKLKKKVKFAIKNQKKIYVGHYNRQFCLHRADSSKRRRPHRGAHHRPCADICIFVRRRNIPAPHPRIQRRCHAGHLRVSRVSACPCLHIPLRTAV